jgi:hypothetical protein
MILKFEDFITEQSIINSIDIDIINESKKSAKNIVEMAKKYVKKWNKMQQDAYNEYLNAVNDHKLMASDYNKYFDECQKKWKKYQESCSADSKETDKTAFFSRVVYSIYLIKQAQNNVFKYSIPFIKSVLKNTKEIKSKFDDKISDDMLRHTIDNNEKYINKAVQLATDNVTNLIKSNCEYINKMLDMIEEFSDISPIVFADAKIKNKERTRGEFVTMYHSDIEKFIKDYKLVGIEYDKRIKLSDEKEIFRRFYKKINQLYKEEK